MSTVVEAPAVDRPQAGLAPPRDQRGYSPEVERYGGVSVIVIRDSAKLRAYLNEWEDLAACAVEPNIFYEPWMLLPAIDSFAAGAALEFVLAFAPDKANLHRPKVLCGLFPLERRPRYRGLPVTTLRLWKHDHCYLCAPLLRAGYAAEALSALFDWLDNESESPLLELNCVPGEGPFNHVLTDVLNRRASLTFQAESFTRAMFKPAADANAYLSCAISNRHRKALRRKQKRLSGEGRLEFALLDTGEDPSRWVEDFLESEAAGWKGRQKSALASSEAGRRFFTEIAMEGFRRRRLMMLELRLGGRAIAHKCNVLAGNGAFSFKIAFDEGYAQYSPGVLLELENIRRLHDRSGVEWMDSCAVSDHSMINRLWTGRRIIQTLLVAGASSPGGLLVSIMPLLRWGSRKLKSGARNSRVAAEAGAERRGVLDINAETFREKFNKAPFMIRHRLAGHPLFSLPRLIELARSLPEEHVEYNAGIIPVNMDSARTPRTGLSVEETIRRIEEADSWMVLKYVEGDPEYRELLDCCLDQIQALSEPMAPGMCKRQGFIFISSPLSVTPYHLDPEYNFLLQVRGSKTVSMFDAADRSVITEQELEKYLAGAHRNLTFKEEYQQKASPFELTPGTGLHFPVTAPHWVKNGNEVSVSFSVTFRTPASERRTIVYTANSHLRRMGLAPAPFGRSKLVDAAKFLGYRALRRARHTFGRSGS